MKDKAKRNSWQNVTSIWKQLHQSREYLQVGCPIQEWSNKHCGRRSCQDYLSKFSTPTLHQNIERKILGNRCITIEQIVTDLNAITGKSSDRKVTLKEVSLKTSGKYKCEVSAESPSFHTDSGVGELLVVRKYLYPTPAVLVALKYLYPTPAVPCCP
ncbi:hypothetical protein Hamer_G013405 [Homarus americanus]|uniref:Uncharacterized protein n=1 Tax=Homarus americanus TaxID=6706 RepID=A0A8J5K8N3_HOMAM|nr:hypothetical protein Hamer_G013405 [Homarus americanus]